MFTHKEIWHAIDTLAERLSTSPSGLARRAGLDPTSFNPSKRHSANDKPRWPSTESLSKLLQAVDISFKDFAALTERTEGQTTVPVIGMAQAGDQGFFDDSGYPVGAGWDEINIEHLANENAYALQIVGDSMDPVFRAGERVIVAPGLEVRRGDRIILKTHDGEVMAKELIKMTAKSVHLHSANPEYEDRILDRREVLWMGRIVWASQ
jgi:phage repressor protein C with HTH and peptisase S24 domain